MLKTILLSLPRTVTMYIVHLRQPSRQTVSTVTTDAFVTFHALKINLSVRTMEDIQHLETWQTTSSHYTQQCIAGMQEIQQQTTFLNLITRSSQQTGKMPHNSTECINNTLEEKWSHATVKH